MEKLYEKSRILFAVLWIALYVIGFSGADALSEAIGLSKLLTTVLGLALSLLLFLFLRQNRLTRTYGLTKPKTASRALLFYLPLIAVSSVNFWTGLTVHVGAWEILFYVLSMCFVAFLEEVIFRGLLFGAMRKDGLTAAVIVSSLTFGIGHMVNLLTGAALYDTLLQLVYASAIGFCYTCVFLVSGSLLPCILSHAVVNATSIFAAPPTGNELLLTALIQTVLGLGYGLWLLRAYTKSKK